MSFPTKITDHVDQAKELLTPDKKLQANTRAFLTAYVKQVQVFENAIWAVIGSRFLNDAANHQLDLLGGLVGELRQGRADDRYRAAIRLRIRVNRSSGSTRDIIAVIKLAYPGNTTLAYREPYPAAFEVDAYNVTEARQTAKLLGQARMAGVGGMLYSSNWSPSQNFVPSSTTGAVSNARGYDHTASVQVSKYTDAIEAK